MKQGIRRISCATVPDFIFGMPHLQLPPSARLPERIRKDKPQRWQMGRKMTLDEWLRQSVLPKNEARMLLQYALGYTRAQLVTRGTDDLADSALQTLEVLAQRRLKGEPMAYLLGEREFYGRRFCRQSSCADSAP